MHRFIFIFHLDTLHDNMDITCFVLQFSTQAEHYYAFF